MSAIQNTNTSTPGAKATVKTRASVSIATRLLDLLSSVRFGVVLLVLLTLASMVGMLIMQQSVEGFDKYYAALTPSQRMVYGGLGFFDIYHTWYFNTLLLIISLNIVLASIDRFPGAWKYISHKKLEASRPYILKQKSHTTLCLEGESRAFVAGRIIAACHGAGFKARLTEKGTLTYVFAERGAWNRLGAYAVHVSLLVVFLGFFLTAQYGHTGQMPLQPGQSSQEMTMRSFKLDQVSNVSVQLPFTVTCTDIQQKLINKDGSIQAMNTMDWLTRIKIKDETGEHEGLVHLNAPFDYRGYRFFQSSFISTGHARSITLRLTPQDGSTPPQDVTIRRNGSTTLPDGTQIEYLNFYPDFVVSGGEPDTASDEYSKPSAQLSVTTPAGQQKLIYAYAMDLLDGAPVGAPFGGYKFKLTDFEKAPTAHILAVQHDPGRYPFYLGGTLLTLTLCGVFFFSHQRVWANIEERAGNKYFVALGGHTKRNQMAFEDRFKRLAETIGGKPDDEVNHE
jgi:cytochrome c biogenesis protein